MWGVEIGTRQGVRGKLPAERPSPTAHPLRLTQVSANAASGSWGEAGVRGVPGDTNKRANESTQSTSEGLVASKRGDAGWE